MPRRYPQECLQLQNRTPWKMISGVPYRQLTLVAATAFICVIALFAIFLPPEAAYPNVSYYSSSRQGFKRTRVVQAAEEYAEDTEVLQKIGDTVQLDNKKKSKKYEGDDDYDDDYDIVEDDETLDEDDDDSLPENDEFQKGDFDYNISGLKSTKLIQKFSLPIRSQSNILLLKNSYSLVSGKKITTNKRLGIILTKDVRTVPMKRVKPHSKSLSSQTKKARFSVPFHRSHEILRRKKVTLRTASGVPIVEDKIFWSEELEQITPKGVPDESVDGILHQLRRLRVEEVQAPSWNRCGRPKNQFVIFENGLKACARYRAPHQYLVHGEVLCFYLSRLLGIHNVPVVALASTRDIFRWSNSEVQSSLKKSEWENNATIALIQWIDNLERDRMPALLLSSMLNSQILSVKSANLSTMTMKKLVELLQWSDLIVFDYITGNYDRVASMQDAADKEKKPSILKETIHNLVRSKVDGGIWLIDNESGLLDSYSLLYERPDHDKRFLQFHRQMLNSLCLFRRPTVERIEWLHQSNGSGHILRNFVQKYEPLASDIKDIPLMEKRLQERIGEVYAHIRHCAAVV